MGINKMNKKIKFIKDLFCILRDKDRNSSTYLIKKDLNLRESPMITSKIRTTIPYGEKINVLFDTHCGWSYIIYTKPTEHCITTHYGYCLNKWLVGCHRLSKG